MQYFDIKKENDGKKKFLPSFNCLAYFVTDILTIEFGDEPVVNLDPV